jgi:hypothetical protein
VDRPRHDFLAGAALAADQNGGIGLRHPLDQRPQTRGMWMFTDQCPRDG